MVITGAGRGIGAALAQEFGSRGAKLALVTLPGTGLDHFTDDVVKVYGDVTDPLIRETLKQQTLARFGRVDLLVNNAGVGLYRSACHSDLDLVRRLFEVNVIAPLALVQLFLPDLTATQGTIVNLSSIGGKVALPWSTMYCASKFAMQGMSEGLRRELAALSIRVITVIPGVVQTNFRSHVLDGEAPDGVVSIRYIVSPQRLAQATVDAVVNHRDHVVVPRIGYLFAWLGELLPGVMDWYCRRKNR